MRLATVRGVAEFEERLRRYVFERSEEARAVRVGEKEVSERAAVVARFADLFTREQADALREAEDASTADERERIHRLRKTCEDGIVSAELAERQDELENAILAARVESDGEDLPLRTAQARLAVLPSYRDRELLGTRHADVSASFNGDRLRLLQEWEQLEAAVSGVDDPVERAEDDKGISLAELGQAVAAASGAIEDGFVSLREQWFDRLLGQERDDVPTSFHSAFMRRLSPLEATYSKDRAVGVCLETLAQLGFDVAAQRNIRLDLEERPQKSPRACVIASDPPSIVHLITRAQGGLHDYQAFLHEAGHALHFAGCDPDLPYAFRKLSRDHALTEVYSFLCESITREPGWHRRHFDLSAAEASQNAEATRFLDALLFRRYAAKLLFELEFWSRFGEDGGTPEGYAERLTAATGILYRPDNYLADLDPGFYSADYLRAWIRAAQLRARLLDDVGDGWWESRQTGALLRSLFTEGTRPSSEEIAERIGFEPLDTGPLVEELNGAR